jgi:radical SAM superfamily enzyme YgiQ (UPF0313 family)
VTRNCPWSRCRFCYGFPFNHEKFQLRPVEEIEKDIQTAKAISEGIKLMSWINVVETWIRRGDK